MFRNANAVRAYCVLICGIFAMSLQACRSNSQSSIATIQFILPTDFSGVFILVEKPGAPSIVVSKTKGVVNVDESRIVYVESFAPLQQWHKESAQDRNGNSLLVDIGSDEIHPDVVALRSMGLGGRNSVQVMGYYWGRKYEYSTSTAEFQTLFAQVEREFKKERPVRN